MLPRPAIALQTIIGVGIDTSRYGPYAAFLRDDLNAAAGELAFVESAAGYQQLRQRLDQIVARHGHAMRKLLHLAFAIWKTKKPFDKKYYPWGSSPLPAGGEEPRVREPDAQQQAAGLKLSACAGWTEVTAACDPSVPQNSPDALPPSPFGRGAGGEGIDFAHVKKRLSIQRVLEHLGIASKLRGPGAQKRCACPIHRADGRGRTFSVNLGANVLHCFEASCQKKGDVIDLRAVLHYKELRQAALDLVRTFDLEPAPKKRTGR